MALIVIGDEWLEWLLSCIASSSTTLGKLGCQLSSSFSLETLHGEHCHSLSTWQSMKWSLPDDPHHCR